MKLNTVNVISYEGGGVIGVSSFEDNGKGNKEAEKLFISQIKENFEDTKEKDIEVALEDGKFENESYQIFIAHST